MRATASSWPATLGATRSRTSSSSAGPLRPPLAQLRVQGQKPQPVGLGLVPAQPLSLADLAVHDGIGYRVRDHAHAVLVHTDPRRQFLGLAQQPTVAVPPP